MSGTPDDSYVTLSEAREVAAEPMPPQQAVAALSQLRDLARTDPESAHGRADDILLAAAPLEVAEAYKWLQQDAAWWASA